MMYFAPLRQYYLGVFYPKTIRVKLIKGRTQDALEKKVRTEHEKRKPEILVGFFLYNFYIKLF